MCFIHRLNKENIDSSLSLFPASSPYSLSLTETKKPFGSTYSSTDLWFKLSSIKKKK